MSLQIIYPIKITIIAVFLITVILPVALVPLLLLYLPLWTCVVLLAKFLRPDLDGPVTSFNTMFQLHQATINCIGCLSWDGQFKTEDLIKAMEDRVLSLRRPDGQLVYLDLKRSYTSFLGYAFWRRDTKFDVRSHIRDYDYIGDLELLPSIDEGDLQGLLKGVLKAPWKEGQSPWECLLIQNYPSEGRPVTMVILRYDHVLADGFSIIQMFKLIMNSEVTIPDFKISSNSLTLAQKLGLLFKIPYDTGKNVLDAMTAHKLHHQTQIPNPGVIVGFTSKINVETIKQVKTHFKVSFGAVIYSVYLGALERGLRSGGQFVPDKISTNFLTPKLNHPGGLCIHSYSKIATWPLKSSSPLDRLFKVQEAFKSLSESTAAYAFDLLIYAGSFYPTIVRTAVSKLTYMVLNQSMYLTTMPVTTTSHYFAGLECLEIIPINDTLSSFGVGMGLTTGGCNNKLRFSFTISQGFFKSDEVALNMARYVEEEFQTLVDAMKKSL